jgi:hypothetical protein
MRRSSFHPAGLQDLPAFETEVQRRIASYAGNAKPNYCEAAEAGEVLAPAKPKRTVLGVESRSGTPNARPSMPIPCVRASR